MSTPAFTIRPLQPSDDLHALTALLHRAYAPLGAAGMNFTAVDQTVEQTRERVGRGQCFVAERGGAVVGTVTVSGAHDPNRHGWARATPWCFRADVANLQQYAVDPAAQGSGIGGALLAAGEDWAREHGYRALALDTALQRVVTRECARRSTSGCPSSEGWVLAERGFYQAVHNGEQRYCAEYVRADTAHSTMTQLC